MTGAYPSSPTGGRSKGFTLIEILVAVAIGAVLAGALYSALFSVYGAGGVAKDALDRRIEAGRFLSRFSSDIRSAYFSPRNKLTSFSGAGKGPGVEISFTAFGEPISGGGSVSSDVIGVTYVAEETAGSEDGPLTVYKEFWDPYGGERTRVEAVEGVEGLDISYYNGTKWAGAWDSTLEGSLPEAVRVELTLRGGLKLSAIARPAVR